MDQEIPINTNVRYIKLGKGGGKADECINKGLIYLGYGTETDELFNASQQGDWPKVRNWVLEHLTGDPGSATSFKNVIRAFFKDSGNTLWVTFENNKLYWAFASDSEPFVEGGDTYRETVDGWHDKDIFGNLLSVDEIAGHITKAKNYRGTSFAFGPNRSKYIIHKINAQETHEHQTAKQCKDNLSESIKPLIKQLNEKDFELFVELIFSRSGWRRIGPTGGSNHFHDGAMEQPISEEMAVVQAKCKTNSEQIKEYIHNFSNYDTYDRFYFVYHTGPDPENFYESKDPNIYIWNIDYLSDLALSSGLIDWVIEKTI